MSSKADKDCYVWIWLPSQTEPVVAGKLTVQNDLIHFNYGQSYLARDNRIAIYEPELPLQSGLLPLKPGLMMPGCIRDGSPDAWGRRVIINKRFAVSGKSLDPNQLDELTYLLESGSDRIGALDFQRSPTDYEPRSMVNVPLEELIKAAEYVEKGLPISKELDAALNHGTSIGGARPKALIENENKKYVAKFSSSTDIFGVVKAEYLAMTLAKLCGLYVASVSIERSTDKDVLLIERFDRELSGTKWARKCMVSSLTMLELDEMMAQYASYENLTHVIRKNFYGAPEVLRELFGRLTFNILCGNTDDHARNHSAFWDGHMLTLTPAYDICPQNRTGFEASQGMFILGNQRGSKLSLCADAAHLFLLSTEEAYWIIESQMQTICDHWQSVCDQAKLTPVDRQFMVRRQFFNPFAFEGLNNSKSHLWKLAQTL